MKKFIIKTIQVLFCVLGIMTFNSCSKQDNFNLTESIGPNVLLNTPNGLEQICAGNMSLMKALLSFEGAQNGGNNSFFRQYWYSSEFASDNVVYGEATADPLYRSFTYQHDPTQIDMAYFWWITYKIISSANSITNAYSSGSITNLTAAKNQMIGENYFMRAFCYFSLLNFYATQYTIDSTALGVPLRLTNSEGNSVARTPVNGIYKQIIKDLYTAAGLMTQANNRGIVYPSLGAAYALLSKVYLYMGNYKNTIIYANKVLSLNAYKITSNYASYFASVPEAGPKTETIWCLEFLPSDISAAQFTGNGQYGMIASMYNHINGWGQEFASDPLRALYAARPYDVRGSYIDTVWNDPSNHSAGIALDPVSKLRRVDILKFSGADGNPQLASPVFLRISEVYLNLAEANAQLNNSTAALNELDSININRGYAGSDLYNGVVPAGSSAFNEVMTVRRMELAFEGQRKYDLLRNKLPLVRQYWGTHLLNFASLVVNYNTQVNWVDSSTVINYTDPRNLFYIPEQEISLNPACLQNPTETQP